MLISPTRSRRSYGPTGQVQLDVSREQVQASPPWDPLVAFDEIYAKRLQSITAAGAGAQPSIDLLDRRGPRHATNFVPTSSEGDQVPSSLALLNQ